MFRTISRVAVYQIFLHAAHLPLMVGSAAILSHAAAASAASANTMPLLLQYSWTVGLRIDVATYLPETQLMGVHFDSVGFTAYQGPVRFIRTPSTTVVLRMHLINARHPHLEAIY